MVHCLTDDSCTRLQQPQAQLCFTVAAYALVNAATLYVFLMKPFTWVDGTLARFMW